MVDISGFLERDCFHGWNDLQFCEWLIKAVGVAAVPGSSFFRENINHLIRFHFARGEDILKEALVRLSRLDRAIASLQNGVA
jgi:aminotransferase